MLSGLHSGCSDCKFSSVRGPTSCVEAIAQLLDGTQPALISAVLRVCCEYLNLKWFHSYVFKECIYLLTNTFIQICNFYQHFWKTAALQHLWTSHPWCEAIPKVVLRPWEWSRQSLDFDVVICFIICTCYIIFPFFIWRQADPASRIVRLV